MSRQTDPKGFAERAQRIKMLEEQLRQQQQVAAIRGSVLVGQLIDALNASASAAGNGSMAAKSLCRELELALRRARAAGGGIEIPQA